MKTDIIDCHNHFKYSVESLIEHNLLSLKLCNKKLKKVSKVKFLGVIIDEKLKWEDHIDHLQQKLKLSIVMIKRIKKFMPKNEYLKLYNALSIPTLHTAFQYGAGFLIINLLNFFIYRKYVYVSYLELNWLLITLNIIWHAQEQEPILNTQQLRILYSNIQNHCLIKRIFEFEKLV